MVHQVTYFSAACLKEVLVSAPEDGEIIAPKHVKLCKRL